MTEKGRLEPNIERSGVAGVWPIGAVRDRRSEPPDGVETARWRDIEALIPAVELGKRRIPITGAQVASEAVSPSIAEMQEALAVRGAPIVADGKDGPETRAAIQEFQGIIFNVRQAS
jgi:hypothetical protein